jgi:hypothetical protein
MCNGNGAVKGDGTAFNADEQGIDRDLVKTCERCGGTGGVSEKYGNAGAHFSDDGRRRFDLLRDWGNPLDAGLGTCLFAMLNPSTAGATEDDATIRKCVGFARRWGYGSMVAVNLVPWVATDPWELARIMRPPWIDEENRGYLRHWLKRADLLVEAWGSVPRGLAQVIALPELILDMRKLAAPRQWHAISYTAGLAPRHPSRAKYTDEPKPARPFPYQVAAGVY